MSSRASPNARPGGRPDGAVLRRVVRYLRPRDRDASTAWLPVALVAVGWAALLAQTEGELANLRATIFAFAPFVLLAGLHERLDGFLHDRGRLLAAPLPVDPRLHFLSGRRHHLGRLVWTAGVGGLAIVWGTTPHLGLGKALVFAVPWLWLCLHAALVEPASAGLAAHLGRRFAPGTPIFELQRSLAGTWAVPEAAVYLYGPAIGLAATVALALPGQLVFERWLDTGRWSWPIVAFAVAPLFVAFGVAVLGRRGYRVGFFMAVPLLHETLRSLGRDDAPAPSPALIRAIGDPVVRLLATGFVRTTPLALTRLFLLIGLGVYAGLARPEDPRFLEAAIVVAAGAWLAACHKYLPHVRRTLALARALPVAAGGPLTAPAARLLAAALGPPIAAGLMALVF